MASESALLEAAVIIPAYNEEDVIRDCLDGLVEQTYSNFKAFIIDDASTDSTAAIIREYQEKFPDRIQLKQYGKIGPGRARNLVASEIESQFVVFTDADCRPTADWLTELMRTFSSPEVASVGGPQRAMPQSNPFQMRLENFFRSLSWLIDFHKGGLQTEIETDHNPLCNVAYRRDLFLKLNGFREDLFPGEDVEMDFRVQDAGWRIRYNPKALVYHHRPETIERFKKVMRAYGRSQGRLVREYGLRRKIQWFAAAALICMLVSLSYFVVTAIPVLLIFCFRPKRETYTSIVFNSFEWLNGFVVGLIKRS